MQLQGIYVYNTRIKGFPVVYRPVFDVLHYSNLKKLNWYYDQILWHTLLFFAVLHSKTNFLNIIVFHSSNKLQFVALKESRVDCIHFECIIMCYTVFNLCFEENIVSVEENA